MNADNPWARKGAEITASRKILGGLSEQPKVTSRATAVDRVTDGVKSEVYDAMELTPRGKLAAKFYRAVEDAGIEVQFVILSDVITHQEDNSKDPLALRAQIQNIKHGRVDYTEAAVTEQVKIILVGDEPSVDRQDRARQWSYEERINIFSTGMVTHFFKSRDETYLFGALKPEKQLEDSRSEIFARFQYSLLYPKKSARSGSWLSFYEGLYGEAEVFGMYIYAARSILEALKTPEGKSEWLHKSTRLANQPFTLNDIKADTQYFLIGSNL